MSVSAFVLGKGPTFAQWGIMLRMAYLIILTGLQLGSLSLSAVELVKNEPCPVSFVLTLEEKSALKEFEFRLRQVNSALGKPHFESRLATVMRTNSYIYSGLIDPSPYFLELMAYHESFKRLENSIARTLGLGHKSWSAFQREAWHVLYYHKGGGPKEQKRFSLATQRLLKDLAGLGPRSSRDFAKKKYSPDEGQLEIQRTASEVGAMYIVLEERVRSVNIEIERQQQEALYAGAVLQTLRIVGVGAVAGLTVATMIYWGPVVGTLGVIVQGAITTDLIVALNVARIGQAVAGAIGGVTLATVGAPAGQLVIDTHSAIGRAKMNSLNQRTSLACELQNQTREWRERGIDPYVRAAKIGAVFGLSSGGIYLLPKWGARAVMTAFTLGVKATALYSISKVFYYRSLVRAEYELAEQAMESGDETQARQHVRQAREYALTSGDVGIQSVLLGMLSISVAASFRTALAQGSAEIAAIVANTADTLPVAVTTGIDLFLKVSERMEPG